MNDKEALDDIAEALRLYEWDTELTMAIAEIVRSTGRQVVQLYDIVRFYQDPDRDYEVIRSNVTLEEAQAHCQREDTHGEGWFDGYRAASR